MYTYASCSKTYTSFNISDLITQLQKDEGCVTDWDDIFQQKYYFEYDLATNKIQYRIVNDVIVCPRKYITASLTVAKDIIKNHYGMVEELLCS